MGKQNKIAEKNGWVSGVDFPEWGNNDLYLKTINGNYLLKNETPKEMYARIAKTAEKHSKGIYSFRDFFDVLWNGWVIPATPVAANFGTDRGLPISCFGGLVGDDLYEIGRKVTEMTMLSKGGGGTAYDVSELRGIGEPIKNGLLGYSDGIIPQIHRFDSAILAAKQGDTRKGAAAIYCDAMHPESLSFINMRRPRGDINRQNKNIHHGLKCSDEFMNKVDSGDEKAREIWKHSLITRVETGEPYIMYTDNANKNLRPGYALHNLTVKHSQLCTEIFLPTDPRHTFVCCLSAMNLAKFDEWKDTKAVKIAITLLDAVIEEFLIKATSTFINEDGEMELVHKGIEDAVRFAKKSRALGLGALGWHSFLQSKRIPFIGLLANSFTKNIFGQIKAQAEEASKELAEHLGEPLWCKGTGQRNLNLLAIAPNRGSSKLAGGLSQGVEPYAANAWVDGDAKAMHIRVNPELKKLLQEKGKDTPEIWRDIEEGKLSPKGSVAHLDFLTEEEKEVFLTFREINQLELVRQACIRQEYIDQGQSINLRFAKDAPAKFINQVHMEAWKGGLKSLYYLRSESTLNADSKSSVYEDQECVACEG